MIIITVVDDDYGLLFNNRRVSKDRVLREKIKEITKGSKLFMNEYSYGQFSEDEFNNIVVDEDFLNKAGDEDFCFVENVDIKPYLQEIRGIILFRWNRIYPSDFRFPREILEDFNREEICEFAGSSHDKISQDNYKESVRKVKSGKLFTVSNIC